MFRKTALALVEISIAKRYNRLIYGLQKLPVFGKHISNRFYRADDLKGALLILQLLVSLMALILKSVAYVLFVAVSGLVLHHLLLEIFGLPVASAHHLALIILVVFSVLLMTVLDLKLFSDGDMELVEAVQVFRILPKDYFLIRELLIFFRGLTVRSVVFGFYMGTLGRPFWQGVMFSLFLSGLRFGVKLLSLPFYYRQAELIKKVLSHIQVWGFVIMCPVSASLIFWGDSLNPNILFSPLAGSLGLLVWLLSYQMLKKQDRLNHLARRLLPHESVADMAKAMKHMELAQVDVKEENFHIQPNEPKAFEKLSGIAYLHAIFRQRLGKYLNKGIKMRLGILSGLGSCALIYRYLMADKQGFLDASGNFWQFLFLTVMFGYFIYVGESYMKFCFYHLDRPLLKYNDYRNPNVIKALLKERFKSSLCHNFPIFLVASFVYIICYLVFFEVNMVQLLWIIAGQLLSVGFFSLYFLYLYFLIQPFNTSLQSKSKLYNIIAGVVGFLGMQVFRLSEHISEGNLLLLFLGLLFFLIVGYLAVIRLAPKTFRLRD